MTTPIQTTGVPTTTESDGSVPIRREIRDLQRNFPEQWSLYILGLREFQLVDENDPLSYYQIAGIHGRPYKPYNGVSGKGNTNSGYCTHSSVLFLTWHRPYLALFEQVLYAHVQNVANQFTPSLRAIYVQAAKTFRMPYWDWAAPRGGFILNDFPGAVASPTITVTGTNGQPQTINNPLFCYRFHPVNPSPGDFPPGQFTSWTATVRNPSPGTVAPQSNNNQTTTIFNQQNSFLRESTSIVLNSMFQFDAFSNDNWVPGGSPADYAGLEDIHDNVHGMAGGGGHMGQIPFAAFDPVFWLHHTNVDRLFSIWHALNPNTWVTPHASSGTFTTQRGATEDVNSALTPFWSTLTAFWTSSDVKETPTFGYAYPETQSWKFSDSSEYIQSINDAITELYGASLQNNIFARLTAAPGSSAAPAEPLTAQTGATMSAMKMTVTHALNPTGGHTGVAAHSVSGSHPPAQADGSAPHNPGHDQIPMKSGNPTGQKGPSDHVFKYTEWRTNIKVEKHCLGGSFQVHVFLGDFDPHSHSWLTEEHNVGTFSVLGSDPETTGCGKCKDDAERNLKVTGIVPLTSALVSEIEAGRLRSLDPDDVVPYLRDNLHWRVTMIDGSERNRADVASLKVSVVSTEVILPGGPGSKPVYSGQYTLHPRVTEGRPAGFNDGDEV